MPKAKKETDATVSGIAPLELSIDFGRADLNDVVGKLQAKINELVNKVNE